jgi:predicted dehydrogenase
MKRLAFIGLGKQNTKDHLPVALSHPDVEVIAVCDRNAEIAEEWGAKLGVHFYTDEQELIKKENFDAAVVAVPHFAYLPIIKSLAVKGIHIFKEKPLAVSLEEALEIAEIVSDHKINLTVAVQRKHNRIFQTYKDYSTQIGEIFSIHGHYTLNIDKLDGDWRSSKKGAGGGAVIDMGYHLIDLLIWYCGLPERISAELGYHNRIGQDYDVEDTAKIQFSYPVGVDRRVLGSVLLSRIYPTKEELLSIYGTGGAIEILRDRINLIGDDKEVLESIYIKHSGGDVVGQFNAFVESLETPCDGTYRMHLLHMIFIDAIYRSSAEGRTIHPAEDSRYEKAFKIADGREQANPAKVTSKKAKQEVRV